MTVRRCRKWYLWSQRGTYKTKYFTEEGKVIDINTKKTIVSVKWPDGEWYRYDDPKSFVIVDNPIEWKLEDELFKI